jgi:hypothetical protein
MKGFTTNFVEKPEEGDDAASVQWFPINEDKCSFHISLIYVTDSMEIHR